MDMSGRHLRLFAGLALAAVLVSTGILASTASAQHPGWREIAEREARRAADARRAELIRRQYERRRSATHARMRLEEESTLFASTPSTTDAQLSCPAVPVSDTGSVLDRFFTQRSDGTLLIDIGDSASGIGPRAAEATPPWWPHRLAPIHQGSGSGPDFATAHAGLLPSTGWDAQSAIGGETTHTIPLFPSASNAHGRQGITHIRNRSARAAEVRIVAVDESGREYGPLSLFLEANGTAQFNSDDLENGNPDKALYGSTGPGVGDWRLEIFSDVEIEALSFVRAWDGVLMPMHDMVASEGTRHRVPIFLPASQWDQESRLRLINGGDGPAAVSIVGIDSHGQSPGTGVSVTIPAGASHTYTAAELETGNGPGLRGSLGDGTGEWRLLVESEQPLQVMNLLSNRTGHLSNLSTAPSIETQGVHGVPLLPSASDPSGRLGLVRVINRTDADGDVHIKAFNDTQWGYAPLVLPLGAGESVQFDSYDLEQGNPGRGLAGGTGPGVGDWRLELSSDLDIEVLSYVRAWDGLLTSMHDVAPGDGTRYRVANFDPQDDPEQESLLRLINPGSTPAQVTISGADSFDTSPGGEVSVTIPAGASRTFTTAQLASVKGPGHAGSPGEAAPGWQLVVESEKPLQVMSLLSGPAGRLTNLSTRPVRGVPIPPPLVGMDTHGSGTETIEDVFASEVSPIVQAKCVLCHVQGGVSAVTRLVFVPASNADHEALNLQVFREFLAEADDGANVIFNKVQGVAHGGGVQAAAGTEDYANLQRFLSLLGEAVSSISITPETLFDGVTIETPRQTLRRAALVFAGRIPTEAEYAAIQGGSEGALRATIRGLMTGPEFHDFLIRASNDRLLTDRELRANFILGTGGFFVDYANTLHSLLAAADADYEDENVWSWDVNVLYGVGRAPLELIAHVVENDLPYTEILTADYIMANPYAAGAYGAETEFDDSSDYHEFKPSRIASYYRNCDGREIVNTESGVYVAAPGPCSTVYPHAGILNTTVFLLRYPTTATNRNRARSRWTYYHFLGLDIEKSASRTTDPVALADTNNPTLNNPACTVCHNIMDPVAGAFQNFGDDGFYRDQGGGLDSLDAFYKDEWSSARKTFEITANSLRNAQTISVWASLKAGTELIRLKPSFDPPDGENSEIIWHMGIDRIRLLTEKGAVVFSENAENLGLECGQELLDAETGELFFDAWFCDQSISIEVPASANYEVQVTLWENWRHDDVLDERRLVTLSAGGYQTGETWYRDMRDPGFDEQLAPDPAKSLRWLAERIVADPRFAESAVKFWWPAIMGSEVAQPPEDEGDADFEGLLLASNAQSAEVTRLANGFRSGFHGKLPYNAKDLLVEIALSGWFRAESVSAEDEVRAAALRGVGAKRLLTPEELARKTLALTGFQWGRSKGNLGPWRGPWIEGRSFLTNSEDGYALLYGGIDSDGITERARDFTSVMGGVAQSHALQSSYPIVMREFYLLPKEGRRLFADVDKHVLPVTEFGDTFEIMGTSRSDIETVRLEGHLSAGTHDISLLFLNDFYGGTPPEDRNLYLDRLDIRGSDGELAYTLELEELEASSDCNQPLSDTFALFCSGAVRVPFVVTVDGHYAIEVRAWAEQAGGELARLHVAVESDSERSAGANRIRAKLVELYEKLHGIEVTDDSPEVHDAYKLFVEVWEGKRGAFGDAFNWTDENINIDWYSDQFFLEGIVDDALVYRNDWEWGEGYGWDWERINPYFEKVDWSDPHAVARTWTVVLAYMMMDYRYLYL